MLTQCIQQYTRVLHTQSGCPLNSTTALTFVHLLPKTSPSREPHCRQRSNEQHIKGRRTTCRYCLVDLATARQQGSGSLTDTVHLCCWLTCEPSWQVALAVYCTLDRPAALPEMAEPEAGQQHSTAHTPWVTPSSCDQAQYPCSDPACCNACSLLQANCTPVPTASKHCCPLDGAPTCGRSNLEGGDALQVNRHIDWGDTGQHHCACGPSVHGHLAEGSCQGAAKGSAGVTSGSSSSNRAGSRGPRDFSATLVDDRHR